METKMEYTGKIPPLLSIVIATRNRIPYAISAIQSILQITDPRLELVIQDNSDSGELESYVRHNVTDGRLVYRYTPPPFSSIDNFNAAIGVATGEYACLIGDDDGVNPEIMDAAEWAKEMNVDSLAVKNRVNYLWPDSGVPATLFTKAVRGVFTISNIEGTMVVADLENEVRRLVRNGGLYYLDRLLPKLYHGLVHRRCLETVRDRTGSYLGGLSPDIFASLAIACIAKRVIVTDYPLTIPGVCSASSSSLEGALKHHSKRIEDAPHLRSRGEYQWSELVPRIYTVETIWADSGVAALRGMGRFDLIDQLNLPKLSAYCVLANRGIIRPVLQGLFRGTRIMRKNTILAAIAFSGSLVTGLGAKLLPRAWNRILMALQLRRVHRISNVENTIDVVRELTGYLRRTGRSFRDCASQEAHCPQNSLRPGAAIL